MKKITSILLCLLALTLCLCSCQDKKNYRDDLSSDLVAGEMLHYVNIEGGCTTPDNDYVSLEFPNPSAVEGKVADWWIYASISSKTVDEFGVFHVKSGEDVQAVKSAVDEYVQYMKVKLEVYLEIYEPSEKAKLENTQVKVFGNYVVYTMLSQDDTTAVYDMLDGYLEQK
jgi:hypothetical protein